jgi:hypothetical protein
VAPSGAVLLGSLARVIDGRACQPVSWARAPRQVVSRLLGMSAPINQKIGMNKPTRNMIQWPFRIEMTPKVTSSTK